jgi:hypothetical protein
MGGVNAITTPFKRLSFPYAMWENLALPPCDLSNRGPQPLTGKVHAQEFRPSPMNLAEERRNNWREIRRLPEQRYHETWRHHLRGEGYSYILLPLLDADY